MRQRRRSREGERGESRGGWLSVLLPPKPLAAPQTPAARAVTPARPVPSSTLFGSPHACHLRRPPPSVCALPSDESRQCPHACTTLNVPQPAQNAIVRLF